MAVDDSLEHLMQAMRDHGADRIYAKRLSPNDNSKNQFYVGQGTTAEQAFKILPPERVVPDSNQRGVPSFKAPLRFSWLLSEGGLTPAPHAQLIYYPQYPEVRASGFSKGCTHAPSDLLASRDVGRVLVIGVKPSGEIVGYLARAHSPVGREVNAIGDEPDTGVFYDLLRRFEGRRDSKTELLQRLCSIAGKEWILGKRRTFAGEFVPCNAQNCGGYTLEAELDISTNGYSEPDFAGWELKGFVTRSLENPRGQAVTLMTPEPNGGFYVERGADEFVRTYGAPDRNRRPDRLNFVGIHRVNQRHDATGLTLRIHGLDPEGGTITEPAGVLALVDDRGGVAASWSLAGLLDHWRRKHEHACYVPYQMRHETVREYRFGRRVFLGEGVTFISFLRSMVNGRIYYDPGIKMERTSTDRPRVKRRSQFRVQFADLRHLYREWAGVDACTGEPV